MAEREHMEEEMRLEMKRARSNRGSGDNIRPSRAPPPLGNEPQGRRPPTVNDWLESERARIINRRSARERKPVRPGLLFVALMLPILLSLALRWCCHVAIEGMDP